MTNHFVSHPGVNWHESQRHNGPFAVRIGGSNDFITKIDPDDRRSIPPGSVEFVEGRDGLGVLRFETLDEALTAASQVYMIEGFHNSIETVS